MMPLITKNTTSEIRWATEGMRFGSIHFDNRGITFDFNVEVSVSAKQARKVVRRLSEWADAMETAAFRMLIED